MVKNMTTRILVALLLGLFLIQHVISIFPCGRHRTAKHVGKVVKSFVGLGLNTLFKKEELKGGEITISVDLGKDTIEYSLSDLVKKALLEGTNKQNPNKAFWRIVPNDKIEEGEKKAEYLTQQPGSDEKVSGISKQEFDKVFRKTNPIKAVSRFVPTDKIEEGEKKAEYLTQQPGSDEKFSEISKQEFENVCRSKAFWRIVPNDKIEEGKKKAEYLTQQPGSDEKVSEISKQEFENVCRKTDPIQVWRTVPSDKIEEGQNKPVCNCRERLDKLEKKIDSRLEFDFLVLLLLSLTIATVLRVRTGNENVSLIECLIVACILLYFSKIFYTSSEGKKPEWNISVKLALGALILAGLLFLV